MKRTRKEHIVPRLLLSQFVGLDGKLWVYAKGQPVRPSIPENECAERDFYEYELHGKKTANRYERWLSEIESSAAPVLESIIQCRRIDNRDAEIWGVFVASLFGRTRKVRAQISEAMTSRLRQEIDDPDFIRKLQYSLLQRGELHFADDLRRRFTERRVAMDASPSFYHVSGLRNRVRILLPSLLTRAWHTIEAPADSYFLISDCPVLTFGVRGPGGGFRQCRYRAYVAPQPEAYLLRITETPQQLEESRRPY
ncbi:MAG: hypothetical protein QOE55_544 [Acidobacteriaceae bacterium]|jgi:hypothetical protein|nr:hypothetical protein [Acidobacteriaceae bacterium]